MVGLPDTEKSHCARNPLIDTSIVSPEYFHLLGMTLLRGRLFVGHDLEDTPSIAVINQAAARTYWPNRDPIGKRVIVRSRVVKPGWTTIVGVIADVRTESLADAGLPQMYFDIYQRPAKFLALYLRGQVDPAAIPAQVRTQIQAVDPELPVFHAETLDDVLSSSLSVRRFSMEMVAAAGVGSGLVGALNVSHLMAGLLFGVSPYDLTTFIGVTECLSQSPSPPVTSQRCAPCASIRSLNQSE